MWRAGTADHRAPAGQATGLVSLVTTLLFLIRDLPASEESVDPAPAQPWGGTHIVGGSGLAGYPLLCGEDWMGRQG